MLHAGIPHVTNVQIKCEKSTITTRIRQKVLKKYVNYNLYVQLIEIISFEDGYCGVSMFSSNIIHQIKVLGEHYLFNLAQVTFPDRNTVFFKEQFGLSFS